MKPALMAFLIVACNSANNLIDQLVSGLGPQSNYRSVEAIAQYGCDAVPLLARQLEVIPPRQISFNDAARYPREMRAIWTIAALRYITDMDFYAKKRSGIDRGSVRDHMLTIGAPEGSTLYFGIWPSRGSIYFARPEEQREIIRQWRNFAASGQCIVSANEKDVMFWLHGVRHEARLSVPAAPARLN